MTTTTTRKPLGSDAREILHELAIQILEDGGDVVRLGDQEAGPYGWYPAGQVESACRAVADVSQYEGDEDRTALAYRFEAFHDALDAVADGTPYPMDLPIRPDETRVTVDGLEVPPYEGGVAYVRNTLGEHGIRYEDGYTDWLGPAHVAYGDSEIALHPDEEN